MRYLLSVILLSTTIALQAQCIISGYVVSDRGDSLVSATVVLMNADSTIINGGITDADGKFAISNVASGEYIIRASMIGYVAWMNSIAIDETSTDLGQIVLDEDPNLLDEVEVLATLKDTDAEKDVLRISKDIIETSYSAVDAIAQLPTFRKEKGELKSDGGKLLIVINHRVATSDELALIQPQDIKRINRYHQPPLQYARYGADEVIEVFTHHATKPYIMAKLYSGEGLDCVGGSEKADFQYSDSLHTVVASYRNYRNRFNGLLSDSRYSYRDSNVWTTNRYVQTDGELATNVHEARADYSYQDNKYLFAAKLNFSATRTRTKLNSDITISSPQGETSDAGNRHGEINGANLEDRVSTNQNGSLDLYFQHSATNGNILAVNVTNTLSQSEYQQDAVREMDVAEMSYTNITRMKNHFYAITTDVRYDGSLWKGRYTVGANHTYRHFRQMHNQNDNIAISNTTTHNTQLYLSYTHSFCDDKLGLYVAADVRDNFYRITDYVRNSVMPTARYSLNCDITKIFSIRHSGNFMLHGINASDLENSEYLYDYRYRRISNPDLKDYLSYYTDIAPRISTKDGRLDFQVKLFFQYFQGAVKDNYFTKDRIVYVQEVNSGEILSGGGDFYFSHRPVKWFSYGIGGTYVYGKYNIGDKWLEERRVEEMIRGSFFVKDFTFNVLAMNFISGWCRDAIINGYRQQNNMSPLFDASVEWAHGDFYVALEYACLPTAQYYSTREGIMDFFSYSEVSRNREILHQVQLAFSYRFNTGNLKTRKQQRILENAKESQLGVKSVM